MGNFCTRSEIDDSGTITKIVIAPDYEEFPNQISGSGVKATQAWQATITRAQLNAKRDEFWKTRTDGKRRMWLAIKAAVDTDPATALSIIQNAKLTLKTGNLTLIEDLDGNLYSIPIYIINNPLKFHNEKKHKGRSVNNVEEKILVKIRKSGEPVDDEIEILNSAKVLEIRKNYAAKHQIATAQFRLFFGGKELKDNEILANLFIVNDTVIQVFIRHPD